ncbi:MAG: hypothetical protein IJR20_08875 [Muribaculaceae bacterium]|nr:hypothetical protein [Muribaculaceae bacterium]
MKTTAKELRIVHRGVAQLHNGESAEPGVAGTLVNMREREDALEVVGNPETVEQLQPGDKVLLADDERTLVLRGNKVMWNDVVVLDTAATVITAHMVGEFLVVVTSEGNIVLQRTASGYDILNMEDALPQLHLAAVEQETLSTVVPSFTFAVPYAAWQAPLANDDVTALSKIVTNALSTMQRNATSQGRFTGVIMARYAVRLWDDSYLWMSQPVMLGHSMISASYRSTATVTTSGNQFVGTQSFNLYVNSFRLGISMSTGIDAQWRHMVKAIDVLISPVATLVELSAGLDYRCVITTSSGTRRYLLEVGPKPRSNSAIMQSLLNGDWKVVASTACLDGSAFTAVNTAISSQQVIPGTRCDVVTAQLLSPQHLSWNQCTQVMTGTTLKPVAHVSMEHNGRLYQAPQYYAVQNPWAVLPWLDGTLTAGLVNATIQVTLSTVEGEITISSNVACPCNANQLNPIISFPDVRATHIAIAVGNKVWECDLSPVESTGMSAYINPSLHSNPLSLGTLPAATGDDAHIPANGTLVVSAVGNPLVPQWREAVSGCDILALGAACRPIYSGGFGRYPIYIFTSQGIMALPQSTSGIYGEPRLINREVISSNVLPVPGGDALWFINQYGCLCSITGSTLKRWLNLVSTQMHLAWNDNERELWIAGPDGKVQVLMPSGRCYARDLEVACLYSDSQHAMAVTQQGTLLNITIEQNALQQVSYLSHPFVLDPYMRNGPKMIVWNYFSKTVPSASSTSMQLTLRGERGSSCHGYIISQVSATGIVSAPLARPILSQPTRTLRLEATGTIPTGTLLLPTTITISKT